ncbi:MAG: glycosyltransferase [Lachnospiraceae bacterium]|nr:glycosyltransferase [Lachnospiraceae bacterium]
MRLLVMIPKLSGGGAEKIVCNLLKSFPSHWDIDVLLRDRSQCCEFPENVHVLDIKSESALSYFHYLKRSKKKSVYDVYLSHMAFTNFMNLISGRKSGKRVLTIHNVTSIQMKTYKIGFLYNLVIKLLYNRADYIVTVGEDSRNDMITYYGIAPEKVVAIPNGVDVDSIQVCRMEMPKDGIIFGAPVVCSIGRYTFQKRFDYLIRSIKSVKDKYDSVKLILIGEGELREQYEQLIKELGLENNVVLAGWHENPYSILGHADMFAFCPDFEGFGLALCEAFVCGIPCITTNHPGGIQELMQFSGNSSENVILDTGILTPPISGENGIEQFAEAIIYMHEHPEYAKKCVEYNLRRCDEFSLKTMSEKWIEILNKVTTL